MELRNLVHRSLRYYWRTNLTVILGVTTAVAVLAGALIVGDSVRTSLRDLVLVRLGHVDHVVLAGGFFRERLAGELQDRFAGTLDAACPIIVLEGFVTDQMTGRRASRVQVYGIDMRFWRLHGREPGPTLADGEALLSEPLAQELGTTPGESILIRVERPSAIPTESLYGGKEDVGRTIRASVRQTLAAADLGEFSLRPTQGAIRAVFVPLERLQTALEQPGRINAVLVAERRSFPDAVGTSRDVLEDLVRETALLDDFGLELRSVEEHDSLVLESGTGVIGDVLADTAGGVAEQQGMAVLPILTYLANDIRFEERHIPYSLVTAVDLDAIAPQRSARASGGEPEIVMNTWAAAELGVDPGAAVTLEYYVWEDEGRLETRTARFHVSAVVPIADATADPDLTPTYPGITDSDRLSDWDPPFPIDLGRIRPIDEEYWDRYRTTPKAFIALETGRALWHTRYGSLTSLRIVTGGDRPLSDGRESFANALRAALDPFAMGFSVYEARAEGLAASRGATDFGAYFVYFSAFLVFSALLLAALFFRLGVEQRLREIGLLQAVGFDGQRVRRLFLGEAMVVSVLGSLLGAGGAVAYSALMMYGLRTWWVDAVGTSALMLHVTPESLALGSLGGVVAALGCIWWTLRSLGAASARSLFTGAWLSAPTWRKPSVGGFSVTLLSSAFGLAGVLLLTVAAGDWINRVVGFFGAGMLLLVASLGHAAAWLRRDSRPSLGGHGWWPVSRLGFRNATYRPGRSVLCIALVAFATFVIVAVEAFRRHDSEVVLDSRSGTGGYPLVAESLLPVVHDLNSSAGRDALNLLPAAELEGARFSPFRLRPGDDASCLNLYQPRNPRILGAPEDFLNAGRFTFQSSLADTPAERANPWLLLNRRFPDDAIPVVADANSMTYILHLGLGDDLVIAGALDRPVRLRVVGALADSILQGELLMSEANFLRTFPEHEGYRFFLLDVAPERADHVTALLETRLADFGIDAGSTAERLAEFHRVEQTYLSTFQTLGGLGLLLGTFGLAAVLFRNVLERQRELALLRALGYGRGHFFTMVVAENILLLVWGLASGTACALLAIAPSFLDRGGPLPAASLALLLSGVLAIGLTASIGATAAALRSPLLSALRTE